MTDDGAVPEPDGSNPGDSLFGGRYVLGELLGVGGTASVFAAEDTGAAGESPGGRSRPVALKILHPHLSAAATARGAFLAEAHAAQQLHHPNIATVHDSGTHEAAGVVIAWIALDMVDGGSVGERVDTTGPMPPAQAAAVLDGVLAALEVAHDARMVHRDVSPANVLLQGVRPGETLRAEHVRLVDFGLAAATGHTAVGHDARRVGDPHASGPATSGAAVTVALGAAPGRGAGGGGSGLARTRAVGNANAVTVVGNPQFMSPEQAQGRPVRAAGDLYQAGALLYYLLTGRPPYPRDTDAQVLEAHVSAPPPVPSALVPGARAFDRVVTRAMHKTPVRRFRDAAEMRAALAAATAGHGQPDARDEPGQVPDGGTPSVVPGLDERPPSERPPGARRTGDLDYLAPVEPVPVPGPVARRGAAGAGVVVIGLIVVGLAAWSAVAAPGLPESGATPSTGATVSESPSPKPSVSSPVVSASPSPSTSRAPSPSPSPTETAVPSPSPTPSPSGTAGPTAAPPPSGSQGVQVPVLVGTLAEAQALLGAAGLTLGEVRRAEAPERQDTVLDQRPAGGRAVRPGTAVDITVASGRNVVPTVVDMTLGAAVAELESAGFDAVLEEPDAPPMLPAAGTTPSTGTVLRLGVRVTVLVGQPEPVPSGARMKSG